VARVGALWGGARRARRGQRQAAQVSGQRLAAQQQRGRAPSKAHGLEFVRVVGIASAGAGVPMVMLVQRNQFVTQLDQLAVRPGAILQRRLDIQGSDLVALAQHQLLHFGLRLHNRTAERQAPASKFGSTLPSAQIQQVVADLPDLCGHTSDCVE